MNPIKIVENGDHQMPENLSVSRAQRYPTKENAHLEIYGRGGKIYCRLINLSTSGAYLEIVSSNHSPRKGDILRMTVSLKQINKSHILDAEVVWAKGLGVGVRFIKSEEVIEKLRMRVSGMF
nr:PilZ domain protein [uncultured bacterium]